MKAQVGLYKFGRHYNHWGIWQYDYVSETGSSARFIKDVYSYEEVGKTRLHRPNKKKRKSRHLSASCLQTICNFSCLYQCFVSYSVQMYVI